MAKPKQSRIMEILLGETILPEEVALTVRTFLTEFLTSHLKTLGTQMGYPIGVFIWVVVEINDQTVFGLFCLVGDVNLVYQTNPRVTFIFYNNKNGDFLMFLLIFDF